MWLTQGHSSQQPSAQLVQEPPAMHTEYELEDFVLLTQIYRLL